MSKPARILTEAERKQSGWSKAEDAIEARLADLRAQLESTLTPADRREALVYRIDELKRVLRLGVPEAAKKD